MFPPLKPYEVFISKTKMDRQFVDIESLRMAGFATRKAARKAFFTKVRVCSYMTCLLTQVIK